MQIPGQKIEKKQLLILYLKFETPKYKGANVQSASHFNLNCPIATCDRPSWGNMRPVMAGNHTCCCCDKMRLQWRKKNAWYVGWEVNK